jgi:hypothetical protein
MPSAPFRKGKVDATFAAIGIGINEEANAMEPVRFLNLPDDRTPTKLSPSMAHPSSNKNRPRASAADIRVIGLSAALGELD